MHMHQGGGRSADHMFSGIRPDAALLGNSIYFVFTRAVGKGVRISSDGALKKQGLSLGQHRGARVFRTSKVSMNV